MVHTAPADGLAPLDARPSAGALMTMFMPHLRMVKALLKHNFYTDYTNIVAITLKHRGNINYCIYHNGLWKVKYFMIPYEAA